MTYRVSLLDRALDKLSRLPSGAYERVRAAVVQLVREPRPRGGLQMVGRDACHLRVGEYRVVYEIDDAQQLVTILDLKPLHDSYRRAF